MKNKEYLKLMAEWMEYTRIKTKGQSEVTGKELDFWLQCVKESSEPVLELGCGTGYILISLLKQGIDISGIDTSEYMMERCRNKCKEMNLKPTLYNQPMQDFKIPKTFGLIISGTGNLSLLIHDKDINSTFNCVRNHLKPGGLFVFEFEQVPEDKKKWKNQWSGNWFQGANGAVYTHRQIFKDLPDNPNIWECFLIIEKYIDGKLIETEGNQRVGRHFTVEEVVQFLKQTGFVDIKATNWQSNSPPSKDAHMVTVKCRKPM